MEAVELLHRMVSIPSLSGEETALARFLVERMAELGFAARIDEAGNAVGILGDGPREIVLLGHLDTVPGGPPVAIRDGRLYGRGAVDAKGPLATFILAAARAGAPEGFRIVVIGAVEEEVASSKGARHAARCYEPDLCIIGEPSGWDGVTLGYKGRLVLQARRSKPTVHSATDEPSAAEELVSFWNAIVDHVNRLDESRDASAKVFERLQRRLQAIESQVEGNAETAKATIGFRLPPGLMPEDLQSELETLDRATDLRLEFTAAEPAWVEDRRSPLVRSFLRALRQANARPRLKVKTGTSDMNVVGPLWSCPIVAYGPGHSRLDHTPEEHVELGELLKAIDILEAVLRNPPRPVVARHSWRALGQFSTGVAVVDGGSGALGHIRHRA